MPLDKKIKFASLREDLLSHKMVSLTLLSPFRSLLERSVKLLYTRRPCRQVVFSSGVFGHVQGT